MVWSVRSFEISEDRVTKKKKKKERKKSAQNSCEWQWPVGSGSHGCICQQLMGADHLVMFMCRVFSYVVGRGCLLWPVHFLGKTLLVFALLHSVFQGQICLLLQMFLDFLLLHSSPLKWKGHLFWVLVLKGLLGIQRTVQLQLLQRYWLGHRLGLLWYWNN